MSLTSPSSVRATASAPGSPPASALPPHAREFTSLYEATLTPLVRYLGSFLGQNKHEAQDIAHDAYLRTFAAMKGKQADNPKSVLFAAARNLALTYHTRRASRMLPTEGTVLESQVGVTAGPDDQVAQQELKAVLHQAILALPPGCRQVLVLRNLEGLSYNEIAERLGISLSGVEKQLCRALRLLRAEMKSRLK